MKIKPSAAAVAAIVAASGCATSHDVWTGHVYPDARHPHIDIAIPPRGSLEECRETAERIIEEGRFANAGYECGLNCEARKNPDGTVDPDALMVCETTAGTAGQPD